jgi:hypothetical protein
MDDTDGNTCIVYVGQGILFHSVGGIQNLQKNAANLVLVTSFQFCSTRWAKSLWPILKFNNRFCITKKNVKLILFDGYTHKVCHTPARCCQMSVVWGSCDMYRKWHLHTKKHYVFADSSKQNWRCRYNKTFIHILDGSHQLVTVSRRNRRNSWK